MCETGGRYLLVALGRRCGWCINKSDLCAASQDDEVRGNVRALGYQVQLLLFFRFDPPLTGERLKLANQQARLHLSCNVEIRRLREGGDVRLGNENLAGLHQQRFAETIRQITSNCPFQDKELDVELAMTLDYAVAPVLAVVIAAVLILSSGAFRYLEKHCTFPRFMVRVPSLKLTIVLRRDGDRLVCKVNSLRDRAGADRIAIANAFAYSGCKRGRLCGDELHIIYHVCNARFFQLRGI